MPNVGKKTFGYNAAGKKAAKSYAAKTGKPMAVKKTMPKKAKAKSKGMYK